MEAAATGNASMLQTLGCMAAHAKDGDGNTAAHVASHNGHVACLIALSERGADLNARNNNGTTPAHFAAAYGRVACLFALDEHGADLNATMCWQVLCTTEPTKEELGAAQQAMGDLTQRKNCKLLAINLRCLCPELLCPETLVLLLQRTHTTHPTDLISQLQEHSGCHPCASCSPGRPCGVPGSLG